MSVDVLNVEQRETRGKRNAKRHAGSGQDPAVLYGHKQEAIALTLAADEIEAALRHNAHLFELKGSVSDSAFLKQVQWDAFGSHVLHVDLTRVDLTEAVEVSMEVCFAAWHREPNRAALSINICVRWKSSARPMRFRKT